MNSARKNPEQTSNRDEMIGNAGSQHFAQGSVETLRILVVDDDEVNLRLMRTLLSQLGHTVETTSRGMDVIDLLESQNFDLVLLDIHMPLIDGFEVSRRIRTWEGEKQHIPIIALTASDPSNQTLKYLRAGMDDFLSKPLDPAQLTRVFASCVNGTYQRQASGLHPIDTAGLAAPVLDTHSALPYVGNDLATYKELLAEFVSSLPGTLAELQADLIAANWEQLLAHTHRLKGRSGVVGAALLANLTVKMEEHVKEGRTQLAEETLNEIDGCLLQLQTDAHEYLNHTKG